MAHKALMKILLDILKANHGEPMDDDDFSAKFDALKPEMAASGFCSVEINVVCPCGNTLSIESKPNHPPPSRLREMESQLGLAQHTLSRPGALSIATDFGSASMECHVCGVILIPSWQCQAFWFKKGTLVPRSDSEGPDHFTLAPILSVATKKDEGSVH